jgi:hypothetical protein
VRESSAFVLRRRFAGRDDVIPVGLPGSAGDLEPYRDLLATAPIMAPRTGCGAHMIEPAVTGSLPILRIPCQPRNVSLRRPDEFAALGRREFAATL